MEKCQRCSEVDEERRTLWMSCFYEMDELNIPFKHEDIRPPEYENDRRFYTLRTCKSCRGAWLAAIQSWFNNIKEPKESCGSGIFVREFGDTVEITEEEWQRLAPGIEPVRWRGDKE